MKSVIKKIKANIRPIMQIIGVIIICLIPSWFDVCNKVVKPLELTASQKWLDYVFYFVWSKGNKALGLFLGLFCLIGIRKLNKECMFNKGDEYKNYPYIWYWICAKILGYSECNLILVPVYMQFKLVIKDTFEKYYCGNMNRKENDVVSVNQINYSNASNEVNLMISDTYPLNINQMPVSKRGKPTILVSRDNITDRNRYDSPELVQAIVNEVRNLPQHFRKINIYASTNPQNTMKIAQDAFKVGERGNLDLVTVFPQKGAADNWKFEKKGKIIYKR